VTAKAGLLADIERSWAALTATLDRLTEQQLTVRQDAEGWTVVDHVTHLTAWERSIVFFLQGQARHEGLGVDEAVYLRGDDDEINAIICRQRRGLRPEEALVQLRDVHGQLLRLLPPLTDGGLQLPYRHYLPDEPGDGDGPPALEVIHGNSAGHFAEHLAWIEVLIA
jgi:hypothetical protein